MATVICDKCGKEYNTRLWKKGDQHKGCGGEFCNKLLDSRAESRVVEVN